MAHGQQDLRSSLDLIENDGARGQQRIRIAFGLIENSYIVESEIRPRRLNRPRECGFSSLPRTRQYGDGQNPKSRLDIAAEPPWSNLFHIM